MSVFTELSRFSRRCFFVAAFLPAVLAVGEDRKAKPSRDYVVKAYPAQITIALPEEELTLQSRMPCNRQLFQVLPKGSIPEKAAEIEARTVYVLHIGEWSQVNGSYGLTRSRWYAFRPVFEKNACYFVQTGFKANGDPLLYGDKSVLFLGIHYFRDPIDTRNFKAGYKVSVTPDVAENVQDLGLLIAGVLGATVPAGGHAEAIPYTGPATHTLITFAKIRGLKRLPFLMNFTFTLALNPQGSLPAARVGVPYSSNITPSGGNGAYRFAIIEGSLPDGIGIDPQTGVVSGTPISSSTRNYSFQVLMTDGSEPPNQGVIKAGIEVIPSVVMSPPDTSATSQRLPVATKGVPYAASLKGVGPRVPTTFAKGDGFPAWLTLDEKTGSIGGNPDAVGRKSFTVQQTAAGSTKPLTFILDVVAPLPDGVTGRVYDGGVSGGTSKASYNFSVVEGELPDGLFLNPSSGAISGVPKTDVGAKTFTIQMSDNSDPSKTVRLETAIKINRAGEAYPFSTLSVVKPKEVKMTTLPSATVGLPYRPVKFAGSDASPKSPNYLFQMEGELPNGLNLNPVGVLDGIPTTSGTFNFGITIFETSLDPKESQLIDLNARSASYPFQIAINQPLITATLGSTTGTSNAQNSGRGTGDTTPANPSSPADASKPKDSSGQGGKGGGGDGSKATNQNSTAAPSSGNPQATDCSTILQSSPCTLTRSLRSDDREAFDFSVGVTIPGVREVIYSPSKSIKTHTDVLALFDIYPFAYWRSKDAWPPHLNLGIPIANQPFHRPYFGVAENLTSWTRLEEKGFPLRINVFAGIVYLKQQIGVSAAGVVQTDRAIKPVYGIEVPVSALASKLGLTSSSSSKSSSKGGGQ